MQTTHNSSPVWREMRASYAFVERNINLVKRYWGWEVVWLVYSLVNSLAITYIGAGMQVLTGSSVTIDTSGLVLYLLIGTLVWSYLSTIFEIISETISWERWEGTIEYTFMAPISRITHLIGSCIFAVIYGLVKTAIILGIVSFFFKIDLSHANLLGALVLLMIGSISFMGLGILAAILPLLYTERGMQMTSIVQATILLISGVYYPTQVLPGWIQFLSQFSPASYVLQGMRATILDGTPTSDLLPYVFPLLLCGLVTIPLGLFIFKWGERFAKHHGKLKRNG